MGLTTLLSRAYDSGRRLTGQTFGNGIVEAMTYCTDNLPDTRNTPVGNYTFGWDANKNKSSETITGTLANYGWSTGSMGFDDQNRLTARNQGSGGTQLNEAFTLSSVVDMPTVTTNGTAQTRTHGPAHELLTIGAAAVVHDSCGNITTDGLGSKYTWDRQSHMATADTDSNGTSDATFAYDALRRRVRKTVVGGTNNIFVSLGHDLIADYLAGGLANAPQRNYIYTGRIDEPVAMIDYTAAGSFGAGVAETFYYHMDANWHVRGLTTNSGTAYEAYAYSSYGTPTILDPSNGTVRSSSAINNRWMFTAREWGSETKTYHFRYRTFGPKVNRFLGRDPIGYPNGMNSYACWFLPEMTDPTGLDAVAANDEGLGGSGLDCYQKFLTCLQECENDSTDIGGDIPGPSVRGTRILICQENFKSCWDPVVNPGKPTIPVPPIPECCGFTVTAELPQILNCLRDAATDHRDRGGTNRCYAYRDSACGKCSSSDYEMFPGGVLNWWSPIVNPGGLVSDGGWFICDKKTGQCLYVHFHPWGYFAPTMKVECYRPGSYILDQPDPRKT